MLWRYAQHLFHSYAELRTARGDLAAALAYADECLALAEASNSPKNIVKARRSRGNVFLIRGEFAPAEVEFERSLELARRLGNPPQFWRTLAAVGDLKVAQGSLNRAVGAYDAALTVIDDVAAHLEDARLRETFVTSRHILQIRQQADSTASARRGAS